MKILLISYFIAPLHKIGSVRWTKISKYLKKNHDTTIDVLTMEKDYDRNPSVYSVERKDKILEADLEVFNKYTTIRYGITTSIFRYLYYKIRNRSKTTSSIVSQLGDGNSEMGFCEIEKVRGYIAKKLKEWLQTTKERLETKDSIKKCSRYGLREASNYDVVISSYSPIWTHLVAEQIKEANPSIVWIADFRDAYAVDILSDDEYNKRKDFGRKHLTKADFVFKVVDGLNLFVPNGIVECLIPNGFDPDDAIAPIKPCRFNFVYTGSLYGNIRDLSPLFSALKSLSEEAKIDLSDVTVDYAGVDGSEIMKMASQFGLQKLVINHGRIAHTEALKLQSTGAILLLADWNTERNKPYWSGKAYEYMMSRKPIVFIMSGDVAHSLPARNITKVGGVCYEKARSTETMIELKEYIVRQYTYWKASGDVYLDTDEEYINKFSYPSIAESVWCLLKNRTE